MKPFTRSVPLPETRAPHHNTPREMTGLWSSAIGLLSVAVVFVIAGIVGAVMLKAWQALGAGVMFALMVGVPGAILAVYTRLEHISAYGRAAQITVATTPPPIYFTQRMNVNGRPVDRDPQPVDFGIDPPTLDGVLRYLRNGGKTSRAEMCKTLGLSQGQWARLIDGLETAGVVRNNGRAGVDILGGIDAMLADLEAQLGRW